jgi:uncharacterized Zn-binding protein involved in type VI secretion
MAGQLAARLGDPVGHTSALAALVVGIAAGAALAATVVLVVGTGGVAAPFVAAGIAAAAAGGGLAGASIGGAMESITGAIVSGSPDVFIEGPAAARAAADTATCSGTFASHATPLIAQGSDGVFINGKMAARKGDKLVCGSRIAKACTTVYIGGGPATAAGLTIDEEVPGWLKTTLGVVAFVGAVIATGGAAAALGWGTALGGFLGSVVLGKGGSLLFGEVGRNIGRELGNEELGAAIGETFGGLAGAFLGGYLGGAAGGRLFPAKGAPPPVEDPEPITLRRPPPPEDEEPVTLRRPAPPEDEEPTTVRRPAPEDEPAPDTERSPPPEDQEPVTLRRPPPGEPEVFTQEKKTSCVQSTCRQVIRAKTGENVPEGDLRDQSRQRGAIVPDTGTDFNDAPKLLRDNGVPEASDVKHGQTVDDLAYATRNGDPAIAHVDNHDGTSHVVTVRGVQNNPDGTRDLIVQDPAEASGGKTTTVPESEFKKDFNGQAVTTNKD